MINALKYYYNMDIIEIHQKKNIYRFNIHNEKYILNPYYGTKEELEEIYNLSIYLETIGVLCHKIIINNEGNILTQINGINYILLSIKIENRIIELKDIMYLSNIYIDNKTYKIIKRENWSSLWSKKIDYIEDQIDKSKNKNQIIKKSIDYYIGIVENCIQMLNQEIKGDTIKTIAHRRIKKNDSTEEFYNPLSFILDNRVRDIGEYIKEYITDNINLIQIIEQYINYSKLNSDEIKLLFIRILYPSIYLDKCEIILEKKSKEEIINQEIKKINQIEQEIKKIYNYLNNYTSMPEIEWIKKEQLSNINNTFYFRNFIN